jgi:hypothetical protein
MLQFCSSADATVSDDVSATVTYRLILRSAWTHISVTLRTSAAATISDSSSVIAPFVIKGITQQSPSQSTGRTTNCSTTPAVDDSSDQRSTYGSRRSILPAPLRSTACNSTNHKHKDNPDNQFFHGWPFPFHI